MKILMILDNLSVDSGVSSIVMNLYKNIDPTRIRVDFLIFKNGNNSYVDEVKKNGSQVFCLRNPLSLKTVILGVMDLKKFFKDNSSKYDVVHLHSPTLSEFTLKYAKKYGIKTRIIHSHSTMTSMNYIKKFINYFLQKNVCEYANRFWACSTEAAEFLYGKDFCYTHDIQLIKNAVNLKKYKYDEHIRNKIRKEIGWEEKIIITHVSNFSPIKNVKFIVEIIDCLANKRNDLRFLFVGDGPTRLEVQNDIRERNLEQYCYFTGRTKNVSNYLNVSDVLVLPSIKEGLPVAVVEAQANGLKCIVSDSITKEVNNGNVIFVKTIVENWIKEIDEIKPFNSEERIRECEKFFYSEFNIINEAKRVQQIYLDLE